MLRVSNDFDPNRLAPEFSPALVSCFDHENPDCDEDYYAAITVAYGQYEDMQNAYLYAKESVLPWIKENGVQAITPALLLQWVSEAHRHIAQSLGKQIGFVAGEYSVSQVLRWHWGASTQEIVGGYIYGYDTKKHITDVAIENKWTLKEVKDLFRVLDKIIKTQQPVREQIIENASKYHVHNINTVSLGSMMLTEAFYGEALTKKDKDIISRMVTVCLRPSDYAQAMQVFAKKFVAGWQQCDVNHDEQFSTLLLDAFNGIAGIHAYPNCNGRTATWLLNLVSVSMSKPSFILRAPGDKGNANSDYSRAIEMINTDESLFKQHVLTLIKKAEAGEQVDDAKNYNIAIRRNQTLQLIREMAAASSPSKMAGICRDVLMKVQALVIPQYGLHNLEVNERETMCAYSGFELEAFKSAHASMMSAQSSTKLSQFSNRVAICSYTRDEIGAIKDILLMMTGCNGWKDYRNGTVMLLYVDSKPEAQRVEALIQVEKVGAVSLKKDPAKNKSVIQLTTVNINKLLQYRERVSSSLLLEGAGSQAIPVVKK